MSDDIFKKNKCKLSLYTAKGCSRETVSQIFSFYNFTEKEVIKDIVERKNNPAKVNQCNTGLCGIAVIAYMYASKNYTDYAQFVINMHRNGVATSKAGYSITTTEDNHLQHYSQNSKSYPVDIDGRKMLPADFIFLASVADFENVLFDYNPRNPNLWSFVTEAIEGTSAFTMPNIVGKLMEKLIGFKTVEWISEKVNIKNSFTEKLIELRNIERDIKNKYTICMLSNGNLASKKPATLPTHWIVIEKFKVLPDMENIEMEFFTWGKIKGRDKPFKVSFEIFFSNYFGFFRAK